MRMFFSVLLLCFCACGAYANSLLVAGDFPKSASDYSFAERVAVLADGYADWDSEYDENGRCIKHCAYAGMTIQDEMDIIREEQEQAERDLKSAGYNVVPIDNVQVSQNILFSMANSDIPTGVPVNYSPIKITSPFGWRIHPVSGKRSNHRAIDIAVPKGTGVVSPGDGVGVRRINDSSCGWGVEIKHGGEYSTLYCHLSQVLVPVGTSVQRGDLVAYSGGVVGEPGSGTSTGAHLHYAIKRNGNPIAPHILNSVLR